MAGGKRTKPGEVIWAEAKFPYKKKDDRELSLSKHEKVKLIELHESGWWIGENMQRQVGFLPGNYVQILKDYNKKPTEDEIRWNKPKSGGYDPNASQDEGIIIDPLNEDEEVVPPKTPSRNEKKVNIEDIFGDADLELSDGDVSDESDVDLDELGDLLASNNDLTKDMPKPKPKKSKPIDECTPEKYKELRTNFEALKTEHESLETSFKSFKEKANEQAQKRSNLQTSILKKQIEKLKGDKDRLTKQYDELKSVLGSTEGVAESNVTSAEVNALRAEIDQLKKSGEDYENQLSEYKNSVDSLESERDDLTTQLSKNKAKLAAALKTGSNAPISSSVAASSVVNEETWNKTKKKLMELATVVKTQKKKLDKHTQLAIAQNKKQKTLEATVKEQKTVIASMQNGKAAPDASTNGSASPEIAAENTKLKNQVESLKKDIGSMKEKTAALASALEKTKAKSDAIDKDKKALEDKLDSLNKGQQSASEASSNKIDVLKEQIAKSKDAQRVALDALRRELEEKHSKEIQYLEDKVEKENEVATNKAEKQLTLAMNQAEKKIQSLVSEKEKLSQQSTSAITQIKNKMEKQQQTFDDTKKKLATALQKLQDDLKNSKANHEKKDIVIKALKKRAESSAHTVTLLKSFRKQLFALKELQKSFTTQVGGQMGEFNEELIEFKANALKPLTRTLKDATSKYKDEVKARKLIFNELQDLKGKIRIMVRVRPILSSDNSTGTCISTKENLEIKVSDSEHKKNHKYEFDHVFKPGTSQKSVYDEVNGLATSVMDGYNTCIFAYGQTGSGKTYTMEGSSSDRGVNYRTIESLFKIIEERSDYTYKIEVAVMEIYCSNLYDLLSPNRAKLSIQMANNKSIVPDLVKVPVSSSSEITKQLQLAQQNRSQASTDMNAHSSRSHCIVSLFVEGVNNITGVKIRGKLNLIDLAGSERIKLSNVSGQQLEEAKAINSSLSALGDVISSLGSKKGHVPFRNSKLTSVLQDSLTGHSKVMMFVNVSPITESVSETLCSLKFANRVKKVDLGKAKKNIVK